MKSILVLSIFFVATAKANQESLARLPDIGPSGDFQSEQEIREIEKQLFQQFGSSEFELFSDQTAGSPMSIPAKYSYVDPTGEVPKNLLSNALYVYENNGHLFSNKDYITVVDFSKRSNLQRFWVINMNTGSVWGLRTTHGAGGDKDHDGYVEEVSNISGSHMSSKGYYKVAEVYSGKWGRSIRMDGLSSTNSKARPRAIVIHGADYVLEQNVIQGRSWGCFVLAWSVKDDVVDIIRNGSLLYADFSGVK